MTEFFDAHRPATAFDHDSTLVVAMEFSGIGLIGLLSAEHLGRVQAEPRGWPGQARPRR